MLREDFPFGPEWASLYTRRRRRAQDFFTAPGIREFVAGTGGKNHRPFGDPLPTSEVRNADTFGVLKLTLHAASYDWEFLPEPGKSFHDPGSSACHPAPPQSY